jgi:hypothetical protein
MDKSELVTDASAQLDKQLEEDIAKQHACQHRLLQPKAADAQQDKPSPAMQADAKPVCHNKLPQLEAAHAQMDMISSIMNLDAE